MRVVLFSRDKEVQKAFEPLGVKGGLPLTCNPPLSLKKMLKSLKSDDVVYLDAAGQDEKELQKVSRVLRKKEVCFGFVDAKNRVRDVALLFHLGASDYINAEVLRKGLDQDRIENAFTFRDQGRPAEAGVELAPPGKRASKKVPSRKRRNRAIAPERIPPPAASWEEVEEGEEYTFCLMYVELDSLAELRKNLSDKNITRTIHTFKEYVERSITSARGRLWMWNDFNGLALFPFDGERCDAVLPCLRLMLARRIFSADLPFLNTPLSYRIALHIGSTVYRRKGDTGGIVSDALNSIFHLGRKYLKPGNFYITKEVFAHTHECLRQCFFEAGGYERFSVMRMRLPR